MKTILLVDDDEAFRYAAARVLEADGFRVLAAPDSMSALALVDADQPIDLAVIDVRMPSGQPNGIALARMAGLRRRGLPIVLVTAFPEIIAQEHVEHATRLEKPLSLALLSAEIADRLAPAA